MPEVDDTERIALMKGRECYVFFFSPRDVQDLYAVFGRFACDPALSFSGFDSAALIGSVRGRLRELSREVGP